MSPHTYKNIDFLFKNNNKNVFLKIWWAGLLFASSFGAALGGHSSGPSLNWRLAWPLLRPWLGWHLALSSCWMDRPVIFVKKRGSKLFMKKCTSELKTPQSVANAKLFGVPCNDCQLSLLVGSADLLTNFVVAILALLNWLICVNKGVEFWLALKC